MCLCLIGVSVVCVEWNKKGQIKLNGTENQTILLSILDSSALVASDPSRSLNLYAMHSFAITIPTSHLSKINNGSCGKGIIMMYFSGGA